MFDLKKLIKVQRELQLSFAGNANMLSPDGVSFQAIWGCGKSCSGSCEGTCEGDCWGRKSSNDACIIS